MMVGHLYRLVRFGISGSIVTLLCYGIYLACIGLGWHYLAANIMSWLAGLSLSYLLNKHFTFASRRKTSSSLMLSFGFIYIGQFFVGMLGLAFIVEILKVDARFAYILNLVLTASFSYLCLHRLFYRQ